MSELQKIVVGIRSSNLSKSQTNLLLQELLKKDPKLNKDIFDRISSLIYDSHLNFELHVSPNGLGEIYNQADLCIGSSGISALERCFFCIPSLLILKAKNQLNLGNKLQEYGLANSIKLDDDLKLDKEIQVFLNDSKRNLEMHKKCINFLTLDGSKNIASKIERASQN